MKFLEVIRLLLAVSILINGLFVTMGDVDPWVGLAIEIPVMLSFMWLQVVLMTRRGG